MYSHGALRCKENVGLEEVSIKYWKSKDDGNLWNFLKEAGLKSFLLRAQGFDRDFVSWLTKEGWKKSSITEMMSAEAIRKATKLPNIGFKYDFSKTLKVKEWLIKEMGDKRGDKLTMESYGEEWQSLAGFVSKVFILDGGFTVPSQEHIVIMNKLRRNEDFDFCYFISEHFHNHMMKMQGNMSFHPIHVVVCWLVYKHSLGSSSHNPMPHLNGNESRFPPGLVCHKENSTISQSYVPSKRILDEDFGETKHKDVEMKRNHHGKKIKVWDLENEEEVMEDCIGKLTKSFGSSSIQPTSSNPKRILDEDFLETKYKDVELKGDHHAKKTKKSDLVEEQLIEGFLAKLTKPCGSSSIKTTRSSSTQATSSNVILIPWKEKEDEIFKEKPSKDNGKHHVKSTKVWDLTNEEEDIRESSGKFTKSVFESSMQPSTNMLLLPLKDKEIEFSSNICDACMKICTKHHLRKSSSLVDGKEHSSFCIHKSIKEHLEIVENGGGLVAEWPTGFTWRLNLASSKTFRVWLDDLASGPQKNKEIKLVFTHVEEDDFIMRILGPNNCEMPSSPRPTKLKPLRAEKKIRIIPMKEHNKEVKFCIPMTKSAISKSHLRLPLYAWTQMPMKELPCEITLHLDSQKWTVQYILYGFTRNGKCEEDHRFCDDWKQVVIDNNLKPEDKCYFRLRDGVKWAFDLKIERKDISKE